MLGKLMKYEMKSVLRVFIPVYIGLLIFAVWARIMITLDSKTAAHQALSFVTGLSVLVYIFMIFATEIITFIIIIKRFYKSILCDEGYLTNTLPVKSETVITSKMISSLIWVIIGAFIIAVSLLILSWSPKAAPNTEEMIKMGGNPLFFIFFEDTGIKIAEAVVAALCAGSQILHIYASISLGHLLSKHRVLGAFAAFIGLGIAFSMITAILSGEFGINISEAMQLTLFSGKALIFRSTSYIVQGIIYFMITNYVLKKRLNLE